MAITLTNYEAQQINVLLTYFDKLCATDDGRTQREHALIRQLTGVASDRAVSRIHQKLVAAGLRPDLGQDDFNRMMANDPEWFS